MIAGVGSAVWQTSFAESDGLCIDAQNSRALRALAEAVDAEDVPGLTVRWIACLTIYYGDPCLRNGSASGGGTGAGRSAAWHAADWKGRV